MLHFEVRIAWGLLALAAALAGVLASLYAVVLSTPLGREVCRRRTYWTVIGGHVLMALTIGFVSAPLAGLWIVWSVVCGAPLIIRSWWQEWQREEEQAAAGTAAAAAGLAELRQEVLGEASDDGSNRERYGKGGAGD